MMYPSRVIVLAIVASVLTGVASLAQAAPIVGGSASSSSRQSKGWLMMNDGTNSYYSVCRWADAARNACGFFPVNSPPLKLSAHGYPVGSSISARSQFWFLGCPAGTYNVSWKGTATLKFGGLGGVVWKQTDPNHGTLTLPAACKIENTQWGPQPTELTFLDVTSSDPANPLDDLHVWLPGYGPGTKHANQLYRDEHLELVRKFGGVRCMCGLNAGIGMEEKWSGRVTPEQWDWSGLAIPIEAIAELAVEAHSQRLWINIPVHANDEYVRNAARLYHQKLAGKGIELIVELGNENWNSSGGFVGWPYMHQLAEKVRTDEVDGNIANGKVVPDQNDANGHNVYVTDEFTRAARMAALRGREVAMIFKSVWSDHPEQLLNVFCGCAANPGWIDMGLQFLVAKYGSQPFQLIGIAPYFDYAFNNGYFLKRTGPNNTSTLSDVFEACDKFLLNDDHAGSGLVWQLTEHEALAKKFNARLVDYEGGQAFFPTVQPYSDKDISTMAQTDPRIGQVYDKYFAQLHKYGVVMHCDFMPVGPMWGKFGYWNDIKDYSDTGPNNVRWAAMMRESAKDN